MAVSKYPETSLTHLKAHISPPPPLETLQGSGVTWSIADLDASERVMSYAVDVCDCAKLGQSVDIIASSSYKDDAVSISPVMPSGLAVNITDSSEFCGISSVHLGESLPCEKPVRYGVLVRLYR